MRRVLKIKSAGHMASVAITVMVDTKPTYLTRDEVSSVIMHLGDAVMRALAGAPYVNTPLIEQIVERSR